MRTARDTAVLRPPGRTTRQDVERLLQRHDPEVRHRLGRYVLAGKDTVVTWRRGLLRCTGDDRLARGIGRHLGGEWVTKPNEPGAKDEQIEDMLRVYVPRKLVPAELAGWLQPALPNVAVREDAGLGLFWFDDDDSELTVSAWPISPELAPPSARGLKTPLYEVGVDDVDGPSLITAQQAHEIAGILQDKASAVPVDRYGFRLQSPEDLLATSR